MSLLGTASVIGMSELHNRRHAALVRADVWAGEIEALERRVVEGTKKIEEARQAGAPTKVLDQADLRLVGLKDELQQKRLAHEAPAEILDAFHALALQLIRLGPPEGSYIAAEIPGYLHLAVDVTDADEPPFK